jgi:hypothetical protein
MKRREFIAGLGSAAASLSSLPPVVRAEQPALPVIGLLSSTPFEMCSRWVFAVGLVMLSVAAISVSMRPANRLASTLVSAGVRPKAAAIASAPS